MSPGELAGDPERAREALRNAFKWAGKRVQEKRPQSDPEAIRQLLEGLRDRDRGALPPKVAEGLPVIAQALKKFGEGLAQAGEKLAEAAEEAAAPRKLQRMGFFRELRHSGGEGPSLAESRREAAQPHEDRILAYLGAGHALIVSPGVVRDPLSEDEPAPIAGTATILTDGDWAWPEDFVYYVKTYHVRPPGAFLEHLLAQDFAIPESVDVGRLEF